MNKKLTIAILVLTIGIVQNMVCAQSTINSPHQTTPGAINIQKDTLLKNPYDGLRQMAFDVTPEQIGMTKIKKNEIYGVILDWNLGEGIMTLVCYQTGDASMYLSTGGGTIGGGMHDNLNMASKHYVEQAERYVKYAVKTVSTPLPEKNCITFYFLTKKGKYLAGENMNSIQSNMSPITDFFNEAQKVITELRLLEENR